MFLPILSALVRAARKTDRASSPTTAACSLLNWRLIQLRHADIASLAALKQNNQSGRIQMTRVCSPSLSRTLRLGVAIVGMFLYPHEARAQSCSPNAQSGRQCCLRGFVCCRRCHDLPQLRQLRRRHAEWHLEESAGDDPLGQRPRRQHESDRSERRQWHHRRQCHDHRCRHERQYDKEHHRPEFDLHRRLWSSTGWPTPMCCSMATLTTISKAAGSSVRRPASI